MATADLNAAQLTGRQPPPLCETEPGKQLQPTVAAAYLAMQQAAQREGIELRIASGWRDFSRQQAIVRAKLRGERPVFDLQQQQVPLAELDFAARITAVMLYSALPGASRHHWGTDLDVWDAAAVPAEYQLKLEPAEYAAGGPFCHLSQWLAEHAAAFGFFRPYQQYRGGVAPEPWHLSYRPLAALYLPQLTAEVLQDALNTSDIAASAQLSPLLDGLLTRFVYNIDDVE